MQLVIGPWRGCLSHLVTVVIETIRNCYTSVNKMVSKGSYPQQSPFQAGVLGDGHQSVFTEIYISDIPSGKLT
jgi:hypothetical protein